MKDNNKLHTSYSGLSAIDGWLRSIPPFYGNEGFLILGREVHSLWLENKTSEVKLNEEQKAQITGMLKSLNSHKQAMQLHKGALKEFRYPEHREVEGVQIKVIIDIHKPKKLSADLKTTSSRDFAGFIKAAKAFGYFGQGYIYKKVSQTEHFFIISVQKQPPYQVFILDVSKYPEEELKAKQKMDFLLYLFKHHRQEIDL